MCRPGGRVAGGAINVRMGSMYGMDGYRDAGEHTPSRGAAHRARPAPPSSRPVARPQPDDAPGAFTSGSSAWRAPVASGGRLGDRRAGGAQQLRDILVVEDDPDTSAALCQGLRAAGYSLDLATD